MPNSESLPPCFNGRPIAVYTWTIVIAYGLYSSDCRASDHCDYWIFDAAIDLAKTSWGGAFP